MDPVGKSQKTASRTAAIEGGEGRLGHGYLDGQLLVAMPLMEDPRFERSVIYLCAHSSEGAMGIIVNRPAGSIDFPGLLVQLDIIDEADQIKLPENAETMRVLKGGPVDTGRGFVLHSSDFYIENATPNIDNGISLTATVEQFPGLQSSKAVDKMVAFLRDGKAPEPKTELLTPITITKDNLDKAERLGEIQ